MNTRNAAIAFTALALLVLAGAEVTSAADHTGDEERGRKGRHHPPQEVRQALENGDYDAWKELVSQRTNSPVAEFTEAQFNRLVEMHQLRQNGEREAAKEIAQELGLKRKHFKKGHGKRALRHNDAAKQALEAGDYEAFRDAMSEHERFLEKLTPEKFENILERFNKRSTKNQQPPQPQA